MAVRGTQLEECIDRIVRDVLASIRGDSSTTRCAPSHASSDSREANSASKDEPDEPPAEGRLPHRVITLDVLDGRLNGVSEICIDRQAVVTPAARDVLRERGIRLSRGDGSPSGEEPRAAGIIVGAADCQAEYAPCGRLEQILGQPVAAVARMPLADAVQELSEQITRAGKYGLLFSSELAAALCLANRRRGVRAVSGRDADEVERAAASVGANLLIVQPDGRSIWQQLQMVQRFVNCGVKTCPTAFREALD